MNKLSYFILSLTYICISCNDKIAQSKDIQEQENIENRKTIYDFTMDDIDGVPKDLSQYKGQVVLIVNTASGCGLTPQYKDLEELYQQYESEGLVILGFPANNFMGQEPGSNLSIKQFCEANYGVSFPMFSKISVKGKDIHPLYQYLTNKSENGTLDASVQWNFQKFLIDRKGIVVASFQPKTTVKEEVFINKLTELLKVK